MNFKILDLGLIDYKSAWEIQGQLFQQVKDRRLNAAFLICSHYPVITLGRQADKRDVLVSKEKLHSEGIGIYEAERGGGVTYHGPGQLTAYPIFNLGLLKKDIRWFLRGLEGVIIGLLSEFAVGAHARPGLAGVWVDKFKIASIGIAIKNWISFHGLSINIRKNDLINFGFIRPCGMDINMAALENFCDSGVDLSRIKESLITRLREFYFLNYRPFKETEVIYA
ncbi:MAG: lipoyl(octanoyl) transferase LipB [Candidatus Omnitrophota bacterium]